MHSRSLQGITSDLQAKLDGKEDHSLLLCVFTIMYYAEHY
jgi:hypothetical protein